MVFSRLSRLLSSSLTSLPPSSPSHAPLSEALALSSGLEPYLSRNTNELIVPRSHAVSEEAVRAVWEELLKETREHDWEGVWREGKVGWRLFPGMCSGGYEGMVLQHFALMTKAKRVLEIGVFTGTATLALALVPSINHITALDIEPYLKSFSTSFWERAGVAHKIDYRIAPALETLDRLAEEGTTEGYDLVFIDADKPGYRGYLDKILEKGLLKEDGVILADNTLSQGNPIVPNSQHPPGGRKHNWLPAGTDTAKAGGVAGDPVADAIDEFNKYVQQHPDLEVVQLPIRDGVSVIRRRV
ncbi:hypothetical protein JCM6882_008025 [Rhodosporidiobolus microsporus]